MRRDTSKSKLSLFPFVFFSPAAFISANSHFVFRWRRFVRYVCVCVLQFLSTNLLKENTPPKKFTIKKTGLAHWRCLVLKVSHHVTCNAFYDWRMRCFLSGRIFFDMAIKKDLMVSQHCWSHFPRCSTFHVTGRQRLRNYFQFATSIPRPVRASGRPFFRKACL